MADISSEISNFRNAIYGEEVRHSMITLAEKINQEVIANTNDVNEQVNIVTNSLDAINLGISSANEAANNANNARLSVLANEQVRINNESERQSNETIRIENENARNAAENNRISLYNNVIASEATRVSNENARISAEQDRNSQESNRITAENDRLQSERLRKNAELDRSSAETTRSTNEDQRINNEALRSANEETRQSNELDRQNRFNNLVLNSIDPASTTSPGVVIIGDGLNVTETGKISVVGAGNLETLSHANATFATIEQFNTIPTTYITKNSVQDGSGLTITSNGKLTLDFSEMDDVVSLLPIGNGGTGLSSNPSMTVNLGSTTPANVFQSTPQPGVTGTLPISNGGTGLISSPSMLVDLSTTVEANILQSAPRPGVTGTLPIGYGGTGATTASGARANLGTPSLDDVENIESSIAAVESSTAISNHAIGDYFMLGNVLMKATSAIAAGESITVSNATPVTVQSQINALRDSVSLRYKTVTRTDITKPGSVGAGTYVTVTIPEISGYVPISINVLGWHPGSYSYTLNWESSSNDFTIVIVQHSSTPVNPTTVSCRITYAPTGSPLIAKSS